MKNLLKKFTVEDGQSAILAAAVLVTVLIVAGMVVDLSMVYVAKSDLQTAADAAALAGAYDLPDTGTAAASASYIAKMNGVEPTDTQVTTTYGGDSSKIEVICNRTVPYSFAQIIGLTDVELSARAVAKKNNKWTGEALPFININYDYSVEDPFAWTDIGSGIKGTITDFYTRNPGTDQAYFEIDYMDGISITPG